MITGSLSCCIRTGEQLICPLRPHDMPWGTMHVSLDHSNIGLDRWASISSRRMLFYTAKYRIQDSVDTPPLCDGSTFLSTFRISRAGLCLLSAHVSINAHRAECFCAHAG